MWNTAMSAESAVNIPKGRLAARIGGMNIEASVKTAEVIQAAQALIRAQFVGNLATQSDVLATAYNRGLMPEHKSLMVI